MKKLTALKEFFFGDKMLAKGDSIEVDNERAAALVNQGMAEYVKAAGNLPPVDPMLIAHLEPEDEPLPPVPADPSQAVDEHAKTKGKGKDEHTHKDEPHKGHSK